MDIRNPRLRRRCRRNCLYKAKLGLLYTTVGLLSRDETHDVDTQSLSSFVRVDWSTCHNEDKEVKTVLMVWALGADKRGAESCLDKLSDCV